MGVPPIARTRISRAVRASAVLRAITAGQPPSSMAPTSASAAGVARYGVGSRVPVQSNARRNGEGVGRGSLAAWLTTSGRVPAWRSRRTWRNAAPFGAQHHLWRFPTYQLAPRSSTRSGIIPGAWAPSTSTATPRASSTGTRRSTGKTSAVGLVTWLSSARRVRAVTAASTRSTTASGPATGSGTWTITTRAPLSSAATRSALSAALYSWSVASSSSPGPRRSEPSTVAMPDVAFGTNARSSGSAPTKAPTAARAAASRSSSPRARKATGFDSMAARRSCCAARTPRGQAPNDPWFRKTRSGSSAQRTASGARGGRAGRGVAIESGTPANGSRAPLMPPPPSPGAGRGRDGGSAPARRSRSPRGAGRP